MVAIRCSLIALAIIMSIVVATCSKTKFPPMAKPLDTPSTYVHKHKPHRFLIEPEPAMTIHKDKTRDLDQANNDDHDKREYQTEGGGGLGLEWLGGWPGTGRSHGVRPDIGGGNGGGPGIIDRNVGGPGTVIGNGGESVSNGGHNYGPGVNHVGVGQGPYGDVYGPNCVCPGNIYWPGTPDFGRNPRFVAGPGGAYGGIGQGSYVGENPVYDYRTGCVCLGNIYWPRNGYVNPGFGGNPYYGVGPGGGIDNTPFNGFAPGGGIDNTPYIYGHGGGGSGLGGGNPANSYGQGGDTPGHEGFRMQVKEVGERKSSPSLVKSMVDEEAMAPGAA